MWILYKRPTGLDLKYCLNNNGVDFFFFFFFFKKFALYVLDLVIKLNMVLGFKHFS